MIGLDAALPKVRNLDVQVRLLKGFDDGVVIQVSHGLLRGLLRA